MAPTQQVRNSKKLNARDTTQKLETKKKTKGPPKPRTTAEIKPISKFKEWKLLYASPQLKNADKSSSPKKGPGERSTAEKRDSSNFKGLCKNCKKQKTCILPKPEGGIWRCEDYE